MNNLQNYLKLKDLLEVLSDADNKRAKKLRALYDIGLIEEIQIFIARVEMENPKIEKLS